MKNLIKTGSILILVLALAFTFDGCKKETLPTASFTYEPANVMQYEEVQFTSTSKDANSYLWDFGNQQVSTESSLLVTFMTAGTVDVKLTATNGDGSNSTTQTITINPPDNHYMLDDIKYAITTDFFWFQSPMGGDPYLRLITDVPGQDTVQDLLKLYPNKGVNELPQTYPWSDSGDAGTYDHGYTADYDGSFNYDWTAIGKTGSTELVIQEVETGVYKITGDMILSVGFYDWETGLFTETGTKTLTVNYVGAITPLS